MPKYMIKMAQIEREARPEDKKIISPLEFVPAQATRRRMSESAQESSISSTDSSIG